VISFLYSLVSHTQQLSFPSLPLTPEGDLPVPFLASHADFFPLLKTVAADLFQAVFSYPSTDNPQSTKGK